jgi:hypothetical protein
MFGFEIDITASGAVFDGRAEAAAHAYVAHIGPYFAEELIQRVRANLDEVIRVNHHIYTSWAHSEQEADHIVVTDRWIRYGPWLEGVGSRNAPVTRFKGYHTYLRTAVEFNRVSEDLALSQLPPFLAVMNS